MQRPYIVGNWKMNGSRAMLAEARAIDRAAARTLAVEVAIAPPFTLISALGEAVTAIAIGAQDCHVAGSGAHTGDISAPMLKDAGADYSIVGHSERRADHGEGDALVQAKAHAALDAGLGVIVCVGETLADREAGRAQDVVSGQLAGSLPAAAAAGALGERLPERLAVAYEPVWAIGTGKVATVDDVSAMHRAIRAQLIAVYGEAGSELRILYGGSVNADNAAALLAADEVGGALVGGASLTAESFLAIVSAAVRETA